MLARLLALWIVVLVAAPVTACQAAPSPSATPVPGGAAMPGVRPPGEPVLAAATSVAPTGAPATAPAADTPGPATPVGGCPPTAADALGPFYTPGAPARNAVGTGYTLTGRVLTAEGCLPVPGARIEAWMAGPDGEYADAYRASFVSGADGAYRFESHAPPAYEGRPPHIHLRVSAPGHAPLVTQHYPAEGADSATMDLVLAVQQGEP
jgi:hypothetical protein